MPASAASSVSSAESHVLALHVEVRVQLGAHRLDHVDLRLELQPVREGALLDGGVLEVLRAHADDDVAAALPPFACRRARSSSGSGAVAERPLDRSRPRAAPGRKFIDGEPMKPATNRFCGSS